VTSGRRCANARAQNVLLPVNTSAWRCSATFINPRSERVSRLCTAAGTKYASISLRSTSRSCCFTDDPAASAALPSAASLPPPDASAFSSRSSSFRSFSRVDATPPPAGGASAAIIRASQSATTLKIARVTQ
jgi:hypothetical protein